MDLEKILAVGEKLGLVGQELQDFIKEREDLERDERALAREDREKQRIMEDREERQFRILELEKEAELKRQEIEASRIDASNILHSTNVGISETARKGPKLPYFDENKDDMDAYLMRFERYATVQKWAKEDYAAYLSALLRGKALDVYTRLTPQDANDYNDLKSALLKHYLFTEDGFHGKFDSSTMERGETASQFSVRLSKYFDRWVELSGTTKTYNGLREFIVTEKFLALLPIEVSTYVREHKKQSLIECSQMADCYIDAHNVKTGQTKSAKPQNRPWKENKATSAKHNKSEAKELQSATKPRFTCFLCDKPGHKAIDCKLKQKIKMAAASVLDGNSDSKNSDIASCLEILEKHYEKAKRSLTYIGLTFPIEDKKDQKRLPVEKGFVNRQPVQVLRDTGCTGIIIKRSSITEKQLTGNQVTYTTVDGTRNTVPEAEIHIETAFYTGIVRAICMNDPVYDLIIGNIKEVIKQPTDILHSYEHSKEEIQIAKEKNGKFTTAAPVTTRAQTVQSQTKQKSKPLNVPQLPQVGNFEEFKKEQQDDPNLQILSVK